MNTKNILNKLYLTFFRISLFFTIISGVGGLVVFIHDYYRAHEASDCLEASLSDQNYLFIENVLFIKEPSTFGENIYAGIYQPQMFELQDRLLRRCSLDVGFANQLRIVNTWSNLYLKDSEPNIFDFDGENFILFPIFLFLTIASFILNKWLKWLVK